MAEQDNYWDNQRKMWIDGATGNWMKLPQDGGDGMWHSPDGTKVFVNGQWVPASSAASATGVSGFSPQAGFGGTILEQAAAQETHIVELQAGHEKALTELKLAAQKELQDSVNALNEKLKNAEITSAEFQQAKALAQQESQFAQTLAQQKLEFDFNKEMASAQAEVARAAEMRLERETQAALAANPQDWIAYEFYKQQLGAPGTIAGQAVTGQADGGVGGAVQTPTMLNGQPYEAAPPAYSDAAIQQVAEGLFNSKTQPGGWNPFMRGQGVLGTTIENPNSVTRREAGSLSTNQLGMLQGLLRAGVNVNGKRVSIDPADYFQQAGNSWVPTWQGGTSGPQTQYI